MDLTYFLVGVGVFLAGFSASRAYSRRRLTREARRVVRDLPRPDGYASTAVDLDLAFAGTDSNRNRNLDGPSYYLARQREAGRRAIPGPIFGHRVAADAGRRAARRADEASLGVWPSDRH